MWLFLFEGGGCEEVVGGVNVGFGGWMLAMRRWGGGGCGREGWGG